MTSASTLDPAQRKMKRLSIAVWILAILLCVTLLVSFVLVYSLSITRGEFDRLSPEQRVQAASVIALAKYQRSGSTLTVRDFRNSEADARYEFLLQSR